MSSSHPATLGGLSNGVTPGPALRCLPADAGEMSYSANGLSQTAKCLSEPCSPGSRAKDNAPSGQLDLPPSPPTGKAMSSISQNGAYDA